MYFIIIFKMFPAAEVTTVFFQISAKCGHADAYQWLTGSLCLHLQGVSE
jgi:hypothetical protein